MQPLYPLFSNANFSPCGYFIKRCSTDLFNCLVADKVHMIDYEYGSPNYAAYDIGNHFNEFGGIKSFYLFAPESLSNKIFSLIHYISATSLSKTQTPLPSFSNSTSLPNKSWTLMHSFYLTLLFVSPISPSPDLWYKLSLFQNSYFLMHFFPDTIHSTNPTSQPPKSDTTSHPLMIIPL